MLFGSIFNVGQVGQAIDEYCSLQEASFDNVAVSVKRNASSKLQAPITAHALLGENIDLLVCLTHSTR